MMATLLIFLLSSFQLSWDVCGLAWRTSGMNRDVIRFRKGVCYAWDVFLYRHLIGDYFRVVWKLLFYLAPRYSLFFFFLLFLSISYVEYLYSLYVLAFISHWDDCYYGNTTVMEECMNADMGLLSFFRFFFPSFSFLLFLFHTPFSHVQVT